MTKNRIRDYRKRLGLTQSDLAAQLGVAEGTVRDWEKGRQFPRMAPLFRMTEMFGCCLDDLYPRTGA